MRWILGLGANLGDAAGALEQAAQALVVRANAQGMRASSIWRTAPLEATGPDYLNAVVCFESPLEPLAMLRLTQSIEADAGRERPFRNAPRTLDIDLLLADQVVMTLPELQLPHPRLHERAFALAPLVELDPECVIPGRGRAEDCRARCTTQRIDRITAPGAPWRAVKAGR
ncbi:MAG: 2-amino-4-hydroxy-6-hydroxymethyldihydropteridine diphosphokinase [Betaproteobacteria bacterium]